METIITEEDELLLIDNSQVIKRRLNNLIFSDQVCGLCYEESVNLHSFNTELEIFSDFGFHEVTLSDVIKQIFKNDTIKVMQDIHFQNICSKCLEQLNECYLFISNIEYNHKVMNNYMDHLQTRLSEVEFIDNRENVGIVLTHSETINNSDNSNTRIKIKGKSSFRCSKCNIEISRYYDLQQHERSHRRTAKVKCKVCKKLIDKKAYQKHLRNKHSSSKNKVVKRPSVLNAQQNVTKNDNRSTSAVKPLGVKRGVCELCDKDLYEDTFKTHKCQYSCIECDVYDCIHLPYLLELRYLMHKNMVLKCPESSCEYTCQSRKLMIGHLNRVHLDHHPFTCDMCKQQFFSKSTLKTHILTYHSPDYYCDYCDQDFTKTTQLFKDHFDMCKENKSDFNCRSCVAKFKTPEAFEIHKSKGCRFYSCPHCKYKFRKEPKLSEHKAKVHSGVQRCGVRYSSTQQNKSFIEPESTCEICGMKLKTRRKLRAHQMSRHVKCECPKCGKICTKGSIHGHLATHINNKESLTCKSCGKLSKDYFSHKRHLQWHTEKIPCPICSKPINRGRLGAHTRYHRGKNLAIKSGTFYKRKCKECDFSTPKKETLESHINRVHLKIRPYICDVCQKGYLSKFELSKHMAAHTRPNEIICPICNISLIHRASYRKHLARHTGDFPFKCDSCEKAFVTSIELTYHKKSKHSNLKEGVQCPVEACKSKYNDYRGMRQHVKKVHWKRTDKPFDVRDVEGLHSIFYYLFERQKIT